MPSMPSEIAIVLDERRVTQLFMNESTSLKVEKLPSIQNLLGLIPNYRCSFPDIVGGFELSKFIEFFHEANSELPTILWSFRLNMNSEVEGEFEGLSDLQMASLRLWQIEVGG
jgi:hypothetical protein